LPNLVARKQLLLEQLQENPGPNEREIERSLAQIDIALGLLNETGPGETGDKQ